MPLANDKEKLIILFLSPLIKIAKYPIKVDRPEIIVKIKLYKILFILKYMKKKN